MPSLKLALTKFWGRPPICHIDPEQVVAMGAALQSRSLLLKQASRSPLLVDVLPLSIGVETHDGSVDRIVERNAKIPCQASREYATGADGQTAMSFHLVQGERDLAEDCKSLGRFTLPGLPPARAGGLKVLVNLAVNSNGLLEVTAKDSSGKAKASSVIDATISRAEALDLLASAAKNSSQDAAKLDLVRARALALELVKSLEMAARKAVPPREVELLLAELKDLLKTGAKPATLRSAAAKLTAKSGDYMKAVLSQAISSKLSGVRLSDIEENAQSQDKTAR